MLSPHNDFRGFDMSSGVDNFAFDGYFTVVAFWSDIPVVMVTGLMLMFSVMKKKFKPCNGLLVYIDVASSSLLSLYRPPNYIDYQSTVVITVLSVIGLSNHCADMFTFLSSWRGTMPTFFYFCRLWWLLGIRSFFIPQQRIGRDDPVNLPCLLFVTMYKRFVGDKLRSSVLVPDGPHNSSILYLSFTS